MNKPKILVVDDDKEIATAIEKLLCYEDYEVLKAYNGLEALDTLVANRIDLILLDIMMPKLDGLSTVMKIREKKNIPIILLSAKTEESDKVLGLSMGADDYVTKPFNPQELVARVKSQLRRYIFLGDKDKSMSSTQFEVGGLFLDTQRKQVLVDGIEAKLTATEYKILELLMTNAGIVFSAEKIYQNVWNEDAYSAENTVMVHIRRIREKIEVNPKQPKYLKVVWGIGYKIEKI
jgi:DNA-binding response OmpR family regulator